MSRSSSRSRFSSMTIAEIKTIVDGIDSASDPALKRLEKDGRQGVRKLVVARRRHLQRAAAEHERLDGLLELERRFWSNGAEHVAGIDEVGRGCLAGPVVVAAVILPCETVIDGLDDSKRLKPEQREDLYEVISSAAMAVGTGWVGAEEIDKINILEASMAAMRTALAALRPQPQVVLVDGNRLPGSGLQEHPVVDGDARSMSIAAASVLAKVDRDRRMVELDEIHPGYGFAGNKGYGSADHLEALRRLGPCPLHRRSFGPVADLIGRNESDSYRIFAEGIDGCADVAELARIGEHVRAAKGDLSAGELKSLRRLYRLQVRRLDDLGWRGEKVAVDYLRRRGYEIVEQRYRGAGGEVDVVARIGSTIAFVEVKGSGDALSDPVARVDRRKRTHLTRAARRWLADRGRAEFDYRFDVVAVRLGSGRPEIRHLESAFTAED